MSLVKLDETLFFWVNDNFSTPAMDGLMSLFTIAGDASVWIGFGILFIVMQDKKNARRMILTFLISMAVAGAALHLVKYTAQRDRPLERFKHEIAAKQLVVHTPLNKLKSRSFPSGHSQAAFSAATFFALYYGRFRLLLYVGALLVAISRVYLGTHFPADILVGSLLGVAVVFVIWKFDRNSPRKHLVKNDFSEA